jgi:hypothetical protein
MTVRIFGRMIEKRTSEYARSTGGSARTMRPTAAAP